MKPMNSTKRWRPAKINTTKKSEIVSKVKDNLFNTTSTETVVPVDPRTQFYSDEFTKLVNSKREYYSNLLTVSNKLTEIIRVYEIGRNFEAILEKLRVDWFILNIGKTYSIIKHCLYGKELKLTWTVWKDLVAMKFYRDEILTRVKNFNDATVTTERDSYIKACIMVEDWQSMSSKWHNLKYWLRINKL